MEIICASICYRGFAEDEVVATLENAPALGYRSMEIHKPDHVDRAGREGV